MSRKIIGITVGTSLPKPNFDQTDPSKGDYIKGDRSFLNMDDTLTQSGRPADAKATGDAINKVQTSIITGLATVATSGEYSDLSGTPNIPSKTSQLTNDAGYLTEHQSLAGLATETYANTVVSNHNTNDSAHNDIRLLIEGLTTRLNALADSDDTTLDQMSEVVAYIKSNKSLIEDITTNKVNVSDIVNNLTTNVVNKPLSAAQGVAIKALIDAIVVPTKVGELTNDKGYLTSVPSEYVTETELNAKGYLTEHQSLAGYAKTADLGSLASKDVISKSDLVSAVQTSLDKADTALQSYTETDPTVPAWAKASSKPSYTASEVGADASGTASSVVSTHNSSTTAHTDIREQINQLSSDIAPQLEYVVSEKVEDKSSICVIEDTNANVNSDDNSEFFNEQYIVVNEGAYKIDKDTILSLQNKQLVGNGSVIWKDWDTSTQWGDSTGFTGELKVRYADDPVYLSMKLPCEAYHTSNVIQRPMMNADNYQPEGYDMLTLMGGIYATDYTALPDTVVICIGNLSLYTLSEDTNARWKIYCKEPYPSGQSMFYIPWSSSDGQNVAISSSQIEYHDDCVKFTLPKSAFAPDTTAVAGSTGKVLHFWVENSTNLIDASNVKAMIAFGEFWTETEGASGLLYSPISVDQKISTGDTIKQAYAGRNHVLTTKKRIFIGHNIFDDVYDELRDTENDPRYVYRDYITSMSSKFDAVKSISVHDTDENSHADIRELIDDTMGELNSKVTQMSEIIQPAQMLVPGININDGVWEAGYFNASTGEAVSGTAGQSFRNANYLPVTGGRSIAIYYDTATWSGTNAYRAFYVVQYDSNKNIVAVSKHSGTGPYTPSGEVICALQSNTAYIRVSMNKWSSLGQDLSSIKVAIYYVEDFVKEFVEYGYGSVATYGVPGDKVFLTSPNGTTYALSVSDNGELSVKLFGL